MEITGKIYKIFDTHQVSEKFKKREFVLELADNPMYPQKILFQAIQDKVATLDSIKEGQTIKVYFNLKGREWVSPKGEKKYFNSLDAWKIELAPGETVPVVATADSSDDLPF